MQTAEHPFAGQNTQQVWPSTGTHQLKSNNVQGKSKNTINVLGILFDSLLKWDYQVAKAIKLRYVDLPLEAIIDS